MSRSHVSAVSSSFNVGVWRVKAVKTYLFVCLPPSCWCSQSQVWTQSPVDHILSDRSQYLCEGSLHPRAYTPSSLHSYRSCRLSWSVLLQRRPLPMWNYSPTLVFSVRAVFSVWHCVHQCIPSNREAWQDNPACADLQMEQHFNACVANIRQEKKPLVWCVILLAVKVYML